MGRPSILNIFEQSEPVGTSQIWRVCSETPRSHDLGFPHAIGLWYPFSRGWEKGLNFQIASPIDYCGTFNWCCISQHLWLQQLSITITPWFDEETHIYLSPSNMHAGPLPIYAELPEMDLPPKSSTSPLELSIDWDPFWFLIWGSAPTSILLLQIKRQWTYK